jgi:polyisoprenoid-binding protein YceI
MAESTVRPLTAERLRRALASALLAVLVGAAALGGLYAYRTVRNADQPPPAALSRGLPDGRPVAGVPPPDLQQGADGTWLLVEDGQGFVGYRINEQLTFLDVPNSAVGRTSRVSGRLVIAGPQITETEIVADVESLTSDEPDRDRAIRTRGLESSRYPTATFRLRRPVELPGPPQRGRVYSVDAPGELTLHGVTRPVTLALDARWTNSTIDVAGSTSVRLSDFGIEAPIGGPVVSIQDEATIELEVAFRRA